MAEKKTTKKITKEEKPAVEKKAVVEKVEVKTPYVAPVIIDPEELLADEELSKELAQSLKESAASGKSDRYFEAIGRRKTAVARIKEDQEISVASMRKMKCLDKFRVTVIVKGGGHHAQAEAIRHGTARVLVDFNNNFRKRLRKAGFLTRDPRMRERKKPGLKRARKGPQWAKR